MNLKPNEIAFLNYLNGLPQANDLPDYWKYSHGVDSKKSAKKFIELGLMEYKRDYKQGLIRLSANELKTILKSNSLKVSGKKEDLANRILDNVDKNIIDANLEEKDFYTLTDKGQTLLNECEICVLNIKKNYNFTDTEMRKALQLPKSYSTRDRLWNIFVERNVAFPSQKMWGWYSMNLKNMGDLLYSENKYGQALKYYISTFIIDLSGMQENNYIQELEYISISHSLIKDIKNLIDLSEIDLDEVQSMIDLDMASKCLPFQYYTKDTIYKILQDCLNGIEFNPNKYPHNFPSAHIKQYEYYEYSYINKEYNTDNYLSNKVDKLELNPAIANNPLNQEKKLKEKILSLKILKYSIPLIVALVLLMCVIFPVFLILDFALIILEIKIVNKIKKLDK